VSITPTSRATLVVDLALIDDPELDVRIDRDPVKLEELARDLLRRGLIEPIKVFRKGDRFEIVDGFRRFLAAKSAGLTQIECFVTDEPAVVREGLKYAANIFREDMSPADEAIAFARLLRDHCGDDIEQLAAMTGKKLSYIDNRLALVNGDELVFEAVKDRKITLGVAAELNKLPDDGWRRYYLTFAMKDGATVAVVSGWVTEWKNMYGVQVEQPAAPAAPAASVYVSPYDPMMCVVCRKNDPRQIPIQISVHESCNIAILEGLLAAFRGES
jgi:ParB/RepB/Spo0J family partition protein